MFAKYFFETWDRLEAAAKAAGHPDPTSKETKPVYFRFLTLMAYHCYMSEGVDAAVIECGIGGEYDSTNILVQPKATAVTSLGIDHVGMLGDTIESIAWHKAGVFKPNVPAFSAPQPETAVEVLKTRAAERGTSVTVVDPLPALQNIKLGLAGDFQHKNASVAVAAAGAYLRQMGHDIPEASDLATTLPDRFKKGLEGVSFGGRCETRIAADSKLTWFIDGGHTLESIEMAGRWVGEQIASGETSGSAPSRILIFNQQSRDARSLARKLHATLESALDKRQPFTHAIFCTNTTYSSTGFRPDLTSLNTDSHDIEQLSVQNALAETWREIDPSAEVSVVKTIEEAVQLARTTAGQRFGWKAEADTKVLVTGSLHLVGGLIEVLESEHEARVAAQAGK